MIIKVQGTHSLRMQTAEHTRFQTLMLSISELKNATISLVILMVLANCVGALGLFTLIYYHGVISKFWTIFNFILVNLSIMLALFGAISYSRALKKEAEKLDPNRVDLKRKFYGN